MRHASYGCLPSYGSISVGTKSLSMNCSSFEMQSLFMLV